VLGSIPGDGEQLYEVSAVAIDVANDHQRMSWEPPAAESGSAG